MAKTFFALPSRRPSFRVVLVMLIALLALAHFLDAERAGGIADRLPLLSILVPVTAVAAASESRAHLLIALALGLVSIGLGANTILGGGGLVANLVATAAFLAFTTYLLLRGVVRSARVSADVIAGALAGYLMLGLTWTVLYGIAEVAWPGSLKVGTPGTVTFLDLIYYSYITLMTIGYGDIVPASPPARLLAVLEGFAGMTFTSVVLAVLVAKTLHAVEEDRAAR